MNNEIANPGSHSHSVATIEALNIEKVVILDELALGGMLKDARSAARRRIDEIDIQLEFYRSCNYEVS